MLREKVLDIIDRYRNDIIGLTIELVKFPSENKPPDGNEKECQEYLARRLKEYGFEIDLFIPTEVKGIKKHPAFLPGRNYKDRPNLVGKVKGIGRGRSLIFSGHIDVSPKEPMPWTHPPFGGDIENDRIYGRGSFDMKGGMVAAVMAVKSIMDAGVKLKGDIFLESVVDEEYGGANGTLACRLRGYEADAAIIPEPTSMAICPASRGGKHVKITVKGKSGLGYAGEELINPVYGMGRIIEAIKSFDLIRNKGIKDIHPMYAHDPYPLPAMVMKLKAGEVEPWGAIGVPLECWATVWIQVFPGTTEEEFDREFYGFMDSIVKTDPVLCQNPPKFEKHTRYLDPTEISPVHPIVRTAAEAYKTVTGNNSKIQGAPLACDAFIFNKYSKTPALIFGPSGGNAHAPDEFVNIEGLIELTKIYAMTVLDWCGYG